MLKTVCLVLLAIIIVPSVSFSKIISYTYTVKQEIMGSQTPDDARIAAIAKAKRAVLEQAGTYMESTTIIKNNVIERDEVLAISAGILKTNIVSQKNYATDNAIGIEITAQIDVDTSFLEQRVKNQLQNRDHLRKYQDSLKREKELLDKISELEVQARLLQSSPSPDRKKKESVLKRKFRETTQALTSLDWLMKAYGIWQDKDKAPQVLEYINKAIKLDPNNANAYSGRGITYTDLGKYKQALKDHNQSINLKPNEAYAYNNRGDTYFKLGEYKKAINDFDQAIRLEPDYAKAYANRGSPYFRLREYRRAIKDYNQAIALDSNLVAAFRNRGSAYFKLGEFQKAMEDYSQAIKIDPYYAETYNYRGFMFYHLNELNNMCMDYKKACDLGDCSGMKEAQNEGNCIQQK